MGSVKRGADLNTFVPLIRGAYGYDRDAASRSAAVGDCGESLAKQSFKEECDINTIVRRFGLTGQLPVGVRMPEYGDFTSVSDFQSALQAVADAESAFMSMPAAVRERFGNDAGAFVEFCSDEANRDEAVRLGLVPSAPGKDAPAASSEAVPAVSAAPK